jgi:hypothetical protein
MTEEVRADIEAAKGRMNVRLGGRRELRKLTFLAKRRLLEPPSGGSAARRALLGTPRFVAQAD